MSGIRVGLSIVDARLNIARCRVDHCAKRRARFGGLWRIGRLVKRGKK